MMCISNLVQSGEEIYGEVSSHTNPDTKYLVAYDSGYDELFCSCPHFLYRLSRNKSQYRPVHLDDTAHHCKHLQELIWVHKEKLVNLRKEYLKLAEGDAHA
ncbi:MAG: hypothetical protein Q4Q19_03290 [Methanobrevibacter sp.]|nr:hypothetical protein [Methanobrevibacter sp.]